VNGQVPITMKEARLPMGLRKDLHIGEITKIPEVRERWRAVYGRDPNQGRLCAFEETLPTKVATPFKVLRIGTTMFLKKNLKASF